jgi:Flp pilus assembly protein TadD
VAGNQVVAEKTTLCSNCGAKFAIARDRCPKCRTHVVKVDAAAQAARSKRMAIGSGIVLAVVASAVAWLSFSTATPTEARVTGTPADPLAARRQAVAPPPVEGQAPAPDTQRPFMDASASATVAYSAGDNAGAIEKFEAAVARNPQDAESFSNLGQVLVRVGRTEDAIPHFQRACSLNPDRWTYRFNLGRALALLHRWDESVAAYRLAQQLYPEDYVTTFNLALTLHKKGDDAAAVPEYQKAVALNPEDASFRMALAISLEALHKKQDAAAAYSEYLRLAPTAPDADKVKARIALLTGQTAPAGI